MYRHQLKSRFAFSLVGVKTPSAPALQGDECRMARPEKHVIVRVQYHNFFVEGQIKFEDTHTQSLQLLQSRSSLETVILSKHNGNVSLLLVPLCPTIAQKD